MDPSELTFMYLYVQGMAVKVSTSTRHHG